jgi:hypothetical protein
MSDGTLDQRTEELTCALIDRFRWLARYWASLPDVDPATGRAQTMGNRCMGVAHSILSTLDGCGDFPAFNLVVEPIPDTPEYADNDRTYEGVVISDMLHERLYPEVPA